MASKTQSSPEAASKVLSYSRTRPRFPWKAYFLGVLTGPALYALLYLLLRICGVFYPFYNQVGWDIDGSTGSYVVDLTFRPATIVEANLQNRLRWLPEPTGG